MRVLLTVLLLVCGSLADAAVLPKAEKPEEHKTDAGPDRRDEVPPPETGPAEGAAPQESPVESPKQAPSALAPLRTGSLSDISAKALEKKLDMDLPQMDIAMAFKVISEASGWSIVASPKVSLKKISVWAKGLSALEMLERIASAYDLIYERDGGKITVYTADEYTAQFGSSVRVFRLRFGSAQEILAVVKPIIPPKCKSAFDELSNSLVVGGPREILDRVAEVVDALDTEPDFRVFALTNARAEFVAKELKTMFPKFTRVEADKGANCVTVVSAPGNLAVVEEIIRKIDQGLVTKSFYLRNVRPGAVVGKLEKLVAQPEFLQAFEDTRQIVVIDTPERIERIADIIREVDSRTVTETFQIKYLEVTKVRDSVRHLVTDERLIQINEQAKQLIVQGDERAVAEIAKLLRAIDQPLITHVISLRHAVASDVENALRDLIADRDRMRIDERTNQIVVVDTAENLERIKEVVSSLDREDAYFTRVYKIRWARAQDVRGVLEELIFKEKQRRRTTSEAAASPAQPGGTAPPATPKAAPARKEGAPAAAPAAGAASVAAPPGAVTAGEVTSLGLAGTVVADVRSNSIIVTETPAVLTKIEEVLETIDVPLEVYSYRFHYIDPKKVKISPVLEDLLEDDFEQFQVDEESGLVTFSTFPERARTVMDVLEEWDNPERQVMIRAKILSVSADLTKDIGIDYTVITNPKNKDLEYRGAFPPNIVPVPSGAVRWGTLIVDDFQVIARALESDVDSKVIAAPKIMAINNQEAEFNVTRDEPYTETAITTDSGATIENVLFLPVGVSLKVTPQISEHNVVTMQVVIESSTLVSIRDGVPVVDRREATSTVTVENGDTVILGGMTFTESIERISKVPILGDIPLLGLLFKSAETQDSRREIVLLLTPYVIGGRMSANRTFDKDDITIIEKMEPDEEIPGWIPGPERPSGQERSDERAPLRSAP